jgi:hypothetical protein
LSIISAGLDKIPEQTDPIQQLFSAVAGIRAAITEAVIN